MTDDANPQVTKFMYHGGRPWHGRAEITATPNGRYEYGPGLYLTNSYDKARKHAAGGGIVQRVYLAPDIRWMNHDICASLDEMKAFLDDQYRMRNKPKILDDLIRASERYGKDAIPVNTLVCLCVNHGALSGEHGPALARWLVSKGVDAERVTPSFHGHNEEYVIVYNPDIILKLEKAERADAYAETKPLVFEVPPEDESQGLSLSV